MQHDEEKPKGTGYGLSEVSLSVVVFYLLVLLFDAKGLYNWSMKLPVSKKSKTLQHLTEAHWRDMSRWGLEEPKLTLERLFLDFEGAHPLLYPRPYAEFSAQKRLKAAQAEQRAVEKRKLREAELAVKAKQLTELKAAQVSGPKVLIVGDSIMAGIGPVLKKDIASELDGAAVLQAKVSTGLARPDIFDWPGEVTDLTSLARFDAVIMMLGTNDSQDVSEGGKILNYGTEEWVKAYNKRLATIMSVACKRTKKVFWLGLPPMQSEPFQRKAIRINSWARRQAQKYPCMEYVALDQIVGDEEGAYTGYREIDGKLEKVRTSDGIHITAFGGSLVSKALVERLASSAVALSH